MRRRVLLPLLATGTMLGTLLVAAPANAHGYISYPPSRQAMCAQGRVANCGPIVWEPQSVEGPKGQRTCHGGVSRFAILNDDSANWPATAVGGGSVTFTWTLTARHATSTWEYYVGDDRIAVFDDGGRQPAATVSHTVDLGSHTGRQKVLAIWNVADTTNAFYSCVDIQIGGDPGPSPTPAPPPPTTPPPTSTPTVSPEQPGGTWAAGTTYQVGAVVSYAGVSYRCRQAHTALAGWEPPNVPALWQRL
ncbi:MULTISPECIES: lytic polysaccharide monooxygenase [unclassified Micromonospora]|uniref:lytic polysaccharide monooxygenase n=1 Tax=unclassified Micromonospora TaxID=2617518 RepID=UPI003A8AE170